MGEEIVVALAGNPNSGKTTLFNNLTGSRQHVGNWPGVTVEKKEGRCSYEDYSIRVIDLPGVYSLTAYSPDEIIARNFIVEDKPDVVVNIVDASNLERNLYLTLQILEMHAPLIVALNMLDIAKSRQYQIDIERLSDEIGSTVVPMVATRNHGTKKLLEEIVKEFKRKENRKKINFHYGKEIEKHIKELENLISRDKELSKRYPPRWLAIKLLEEDNEVLKKLGEINHEY